MASSTREWYAVFLSDFGDRHPALTAAVVTGDTVRKWMSVPRKRAWGRSTRRHAIANRRRVFNRVVDARIIAANPIARMKRPKTVASERIMTSEERDRLLLSSAEGDRFRDLLVALQESGCRPGEAMNVTAADVDLEEGIWRMRGKDYAATGEMRVIYLTPTLLELTCWTPSEFHHGLPCDHANPTTLALVIYTSCRRAPGGGHVLRLGAPLC